MKNEIPLEILDLKKSYQRKGHPDVEAIKGVSFSVRPGEIFGLLGPNGAGKTSLISIITTLERPTAGDVKIFGKSVLKFPEETKRNIGVVPQEVVSSGFFNLEELLQYHSGYFGIKNNQSKIDELLLKLNLKEHKSKMMRQLSGGMKRRMMIAKALVHSPKILLLDEPTAGVDVELRNHLWDFVRTLQSEGVSIVLTTHYLQEAEALCDRVGIINQGQLKYIGPTKEIISDLTQKKVEVTLANNERREFFLEKGQALCDSLKMQQISLENVQDIKTSEGTLEDAFVKVLKL